MSASSDMQSKGEGDISSLSLFLQDIKCDKRKIIKPAAIHRFPTVELLSPHVHTPAPSLTMHHLYPRSSCSTLFPLSW